MAKAQFHKAQRVYVRPVGTWAVIERVCPQWAKGLEEPIRVYYDCGLGREFAAEELQADEPPALAADSTSQRWRVVRQRNRWQGEDESAQHPYPGTYPVVVTSETDWGGWRVPAAEYSLAPHKVELQARLIAHCPQLMAIAQRLVETAARHAHEIPDDVLLTAKDARNVLAHILSEAPER